MKYNFRNLSVDYETLGTGDPIILLHGWGTNKNTFLPLAKLLSKKYEVHLIDLLGFGKSEAPYKALSLSDYVMLLRDYIEYKKLNKPIILGHSFGGRIAIKYASSFKNIEKLILVDSAGIKKRLSFLSRIKIKIYKLKKWWYKLTKNVVKFNNLINNSGSYDYKMASPVMKQTLVKVINEDLKPYLKKIEVETLIIWGRDDKETPIKDALIMNKLIKNSGLVTLENTGHFPYLENKHTFNIIISNYLGVKYDIC